MEYIDKYVWYQEGPGVRKHQYTLEGTKLLNVANLVDGKIDLSTSHRYISKDEATTKYKHFLVDEGDLIIASSGIQVDYFDKKMGFAQKEHLPLCMNTSTIRFKVLDAKITNINYFMWFLKSDIFKKQLRKLITGSAQLNFGPSHLKKIKINMPLLQEQEDAVKELDKVQEIIDIRKKQIEDLDQLIESQFVKMFGNPITNEKRYPEVDFIDVIKLQRGYDLPNQDRDSTGQISVYGANGILDTHIISKCKKGIITGRSGTIGKVYYSFEEFWPLNTTLFSVETYGNNIIYLKYLLDMFELKRFVDATGVPTLNRNVVHKQKIISVPIELQNQFAEFVKVIDKQKFEIQKSLEEMQELKKSLLNKYFH